jgi:hypothetical protein
MECDLDLVQAEEKLRQTAQQAGSSQRPSAAAMNPNAAGMATDVGEDTRLRVFDEHLAEELGKSKGAGILSGIIVGVAGIALAAAGMGMAGKVGGLGGALSCLAPAFFKAKGFLGLADPGFLAAMCLGLGAAGLLVCLGQLHWSYMAHQAIQDVKLGGRPAVVGISAMTQAGTLLACLLVPPVGIILGIIFKLSHNHDLRDLGGRAILAGGAALGYVLVTTLWGAASHLPSAAPAK